MRTAPRGGRELLTAAAMRPLAYRRLAKEGTTSRRYMPLTQLFRAAHPPSSHRWCDRGLAANKPNRIGLDAACSIRLRLLGLGALCLENAVRDLLVAIAPGFEPVQR